MDPVTQVSGVFTAKPGPLPLSSPVTFVPLYFIEEDYKIFVRQGMVSN